MKNQVIEVLNKKHGEKVINYWKSQGFKNKYCLTGTGTRENEYEYRYYGIINGELDNYSQIEVNINKAEIILLPTEKYEEEKTFPRVMMISDDNIHWYQRVVVSAGVGYAVTVRCCESMTEYDINKQNDNIFYDLYKYHKELNQKYKLSKKQIAEKLGIPIEELEIIEE